MHIYDKTKDLISAVENSKKPYIYFVLTFFFAATLRNFLELFSTEGSLSFIEFYHYYLSYIALALALILLFYLATKENIERLSRIVLPCFMILNLVPILDLVMSGGRGFNITYMIPESMKISS